MRIFCFPYAGGGASIYWAWQRDVPPEADLIALQLPGRESRLSEPPSTDLSHLVEAVAGAIGPFSDIPFAFFGHSMGALISFELARYLRRCHLPMPTRLFLSAHRGPRLPSRHRPVHDLPVDQLIGELRRLNGTASEILRDGEAMRLLLPMLRADFRICETYRYAPEPPLAIPFSVFGGLFDSEVKPHELDAWRQESSVGDYAVRLFPGDHFFLHTFRVSIIDWVLRDIGLETTRP